MKKTILALAALAALHAVPAASETVAVTLPDYAFDFPTHGYEITVSGGIQNLNDHLTANDYTTITDGGYKLRTRVDRMSRKDRQGFMRFFNSNCIGFSNKAACPIVASGEVELDKDMRMIFRMLTATIRKGGSEWSNRVEQ